MASNVLLLFTYTDGIAFIDEFGNIVGTRVNAMKAYSRKKMSPRGEIENARFFVVVVICIYAAPLYARQNDIKRTQVRV